MNELEKEFEELANTIGKEIANKVEKAMILLDEAMKLSDDSGFPFKYRILDNERTYVPSSYNRKFFNIDPKKLEELANLKEDELVNPDEDNQWKTSSLHC